MQNFKTAKNFTRICLFTLFFFSNVSVKAIELDFSRREKELESLRVPASITDQAQTTKEEPNLANHYFDVVDSTQEIVILNTETGFVPETLRLKKGAKYKIRVVNVNAKEKNLSFVLDAFSEHHGTYFAEPKAFNIAPKVNGIFSFQCPETAKQGQFVIYSDDVRTPAAER